MHLRESRTSKFSRGACPRTLLGSNLRQIYPPVTLKYPLVRKLIETPAHEYSVFVIFLKRFCLAMKISMLFKQLMNQ